MSFSKCDLLSLQKPQSPKKQNLSNLRHKEKSTLLVLFKRTFYVRQKTHTSNFNTKFFFKRPLFKTVIFDLFKSGISENSRIRVNWAIKKKALQWCSWKYLFTSGKVDTYLKLPSQIFFEKKLPFSNCDIWYLHKQNSQKQQILSYLSHKEKSTSMMLLKIPSYIR